MLKQREILKKFDAPTKLSVCGKLKKSTAECFNDNGSIVFKEENFIIKIYW